MTNPDLAADSAKLERLVRERDNQWLDALGANDMMPTVGTPVNVSYCADHVTARLVQVVVERAAEDADDYLDPESRRNMKHTPLGKLIMKLSSPENVAALIAEAKGEK